MTKLGKTYNILIRIIILIFTFYYLYNQLIYKHDLGTFTSALNEVYNKSYFWLYLSLVVLLLPVNLLLDSYKWKYLIDNLEKITLWRSFKAVLAGISVSMFLPNRVGDYLGRVFILQKADRVQATLSTILGSIAQFITTLLFGISSLIIFFPKWLLITSSFNRWIYVGVILIGIFVLAFAVFAYLNFPAFALVIEKVSKRVHKRLAYYLDVFKFYKTDELLVVLALSILRYLVFSFQFYLFFLLFEIKLNYFQAMLLISLIYLFMSGIPTIALSELGVRGSVSLAVFQLYFGNQLMTDKIKTMIITASSGVWLLNLAIPALLGIIFIFKLKFFRNNGS